MQKIAAKRKISRLYYLKVSHRRVVRLCSKCLLMGDGQAGSQVSFLMAAQQMLLVSFPAITSTFPTESPPPPTITVVTVERVTVGWGRRSI